MGNSAGVSTPPDQSSEHPQGAPASGARSVTSDDLLYEQIPVDDSESIVDDDEEEMSGRVSGGSQGSRGSRSYRRSRNSGSKKSKQDPHDRYYKRYPWYTNRRAWPRASERDREFMQASDGAEKVDIGTPCKVASMHELDEKRLENSVYVRKVDLHIEENTENHRTNMYQCTGSHRCHKTRRKAELVIRRGEEFLLTLGFNDRCDIRKNAVTLVFNLGDSCLPGSRLLRTVKVDDRGDNSYIPKQWGATCVSQDGRSMTLAVFVPATAPVGEWEFSVTTVVDTKKSKIWQYNHHEDISIIFNPWCKDDVVYLDDNDWQKEAVLNDSGAYYHGSWCQMAASPWFYGQFEDGILETAFHLLRKGCGFKTTPSMANPAVVARVLADIISAEGHGVIEGGWDGEYSTGTAPTKWKGSDKILRRYMETGRPVRYGQCWVFAGIFTTLCRALGIPSRNVTTYSCGHNKDTAQLSIDHYLVRDNKGEWMETADDTIWTFHVWSEAWMKRPDLDDSRKYDGWQAVDPTPMEHSDGIYCSGPVPVSALKDGDLRVHPDAAFMFGQVNADKVIWREDEDTGHQVEAKRLKSLVGKLLSTHSPTGRPYRGASMKTWGGKQTLERLDVTSSYKHDEGSSRERAAVERAERAFRVLSGGLNNNHHNEDDQHDADLTNSLELEIVEPGDVFVGSGFDFKVRVTNTSSRRKTVRRILLKVFYMTYYGAKTGTVVVKKDGGFELEPDERETIKVYVSPEKAAARPQDGFHFQLHAMAYVRNSTRIATESMSFLLRRPNIRLKGPSYCAPEEEIEVQVEFCNPLDVPLTDCEVDIEGSLACLDPTEDNFTVPDIKPQGVWKTVLFLRPKQHPAGKRVRDISLVLESAELKDIIGYYAVKLD